MAGLYIHIPFCASRCIYCGFYSTTLLNLRSEYVDALISEMKIKASVEPWASYRGAIETLYIGGGTPSVLSDVDLKRLFDSIYNIYNVADDAEITMECNPDDVTSERALFIASLGINRVSMGVQTFDDTRLKWLSRRHTASQAREAVDNLRKAGIGNISLDLIYGFPEQTVEEWEDDIKQLISLKPQHISAYSLMYEEGTPLLKLLEDGKVREINENTSLEMYKKLVYLTHQSGYEHYEISNFAKPGFKAKHNTSYWEDKPYIGIGAGAHGYNNSGELTRHSNLCDVHKYLSQISMNKLAEEVEYIDEVTHYNDLITTQLRTAKGIDIKLLSEPFADYIKKESASHIASGKLILDGSRLYLSPEGIFVSDSIMSDLIYLP